MQLTAHFLCPEKSPVTVENEMKNIIRWSQENKLLINMLKTKEMVFHRPNPRLYIEPPAMQNIERVNEFKLLGVYFCSDLRFNSHISKVLTICNQRLYLVSQFKKQGLTVAGTEVVFNAIVLSKILYALPVFYSFLSEHNKQQIEAMLKKARRWQLVNTNFEFQELAENHMLRLFRQSKSNSHSLNHLYEINSNERVGTLRQRGHNFTTPTTKYELTTKSFILRCLRVYR